MFLLFINLYRSMFTGRWQALNWTQIYQRTKSCLDTIGLFLTSIFGDNQMANLGDILNVNDLEYGLVSVVSLILALITSIGIVVVATKGIKKIFTVFFYGVR